MGQTCEMAKAVFLLAALVGATFAAPEVPASRKTVSKSAGSRRLLSTPTVTSISPTYGPMEGNSLVMVVGTNFDAITSGTTKVCQFGTSQTTATRINATHISCRTPKHSTGAATFTLYHGSTAAAATATFTFFPTMFVSDFKTSSVLRYNADTGAFLKKFRTVKGQPRSLVFHYWDLYV